MIFYLIGGVFAYMLFGLVSIVLSGAMEYGKRWLRIAIFLAWPIVFPIVLLIEFVGCIILVFTEED